jgi:protein gp37
MRLVVAFVAAISAVILAIALSSVAEMLDWCVVGAESGPGRRPCRLEWIESIVEQCRGAHVPVHVKQIDLNGRVSHDMTEWPESLRIRQYPKVFNV